MRQPACSTLSDADANVRFTFYFEGGEPIGPVELALGAAPHPSRAPRRSVRHRRRRATSRGSVRVRDRKRRADRGSALAGSGGYTLFTTLAYGDELFRSSVIRGIEDAVETLHATGDGGYLARLRVLRDIGVCVRGDDEYARRRVSFVSDLVTSLNSGPELAGSLVALHGC